MADVDKKNPYASVFIAPWNEQPQEPAPAVGPVVAPTADQATAETPITTTAPSATDNSVLAPKVQNAPALPEFDVNASALELNKALTEYITNNPRKTKEELEKEERRERIAAGIRALGGMATAFSNLAYTGQGAPSQTLAKFDDGEARIDKWRARNDKLWNDYLGAQKLREQLMRQRIADARYEREWQNRLEQQDIANRFRAGTLQNQRDKLAYDKDKDEKDRELKERGLQNTAEYHAATVANARYANQLRAQDIAAKQNGGYYNYPDGRGRGSGNGKTFPLLDGAGGRYDLPDGTFNNDDVVSDLAKTLGIEAEKFGKGKPRSTLLQEIAAKVKADPGARQKLHDWGKMYGFELKNAQPEYDPSKYKRGGGKASGGGVSTQKKPTDYK